LHKGILNPIVQEYIDCNLNSKIMGLILKGSPFENIDIRDLAEQIESKKKAEKKLPTWFQSKNIYYPPKISIEQTSSEITANYKSKLVSGDTVADLTGGFGVDSYYFSKQIKNVFHYEIDERLSKIAAHNFKELNVNIHCSHENGIEAINNKDFDILYIDPSRRNEAKGKVFFLRDCEPNIIAHLDYLLDRTKTLIIKTSPMLDISIGLNELKHVTEIHIVAVNNDVKELLWILNKNHIGNYVIHTINIKDTISEKFSIDPAIKTVATYSNPKSYLYEPNAAVMKSGAFDVISSYYKIDKLEKNTHLYTSDKLIDFPGRRFFLERTIPYSKMEIKLLVANKKANITTRNFPEPVKQIRKKWKIAEGGNNYLFFTTLSNGKKVILECTKIKP